MQLSDAFRYICTFPSVAASNCTLCPAFTSTCADPACVVDNSPEPDTDTGARWKMNHCPVPAFCAASA